jgi:homoserine kinase
MSDETDDIPPDNETMREVKRAKARKAAAKKATDTKAPINWKTAAGIGIGSAAVVAALLYANKARKKDDD